MKKNLPGFQQLLKHRFGPVVLAITLLCTISLLTRIALLIASTHSFDWTIANFFNVFVIGMFFDLAAASYAIIPLLIYLWWFPSRWYSKRLNRILLTIYFFIVVM